jgi:hypothetical protein
VGKPSDDERFQMIQVKLSYAERLINILGRLPQKRGEVLSAHDRRWRDAINEVLAPLFAEADALRAKRDAALRVVTAARTLPHEIWCDSLPRGTWVPVGCNCWQSNVWHELKAFDAEYGNG